MERDVATKPVERMWESKALNFLFGQSVVSARDAGIDRAGSARQSVERHGSSVAGYRPSRWLRKSVLPILTFFLVAAFLSAGLGLIVGILAGNAALIGFVFWLLPRLGFLALVILLVRFAAAPSY